ncbi:cytochrome P450 [Oculatella sp. LEGE 06141]|uniref:cytochrome P450 n=1 Tax=Oculatella sp. LEGE 06141 TaxID=1828648 RepID=UPI001881A1B8|nr:cytochrome P450 [Oculatella sp. LEGE 06141]MBE9177392.1 cytochrome P450 [Oculatella sp. LEGE 06141]
MTSLSQHAPTKRPDGPQNPPAMQLLRWIAQPIEFMEDCTERYGDTFTVCLSRLGDAVFFSQPEAIQAIFKANPKQFKVGSANGILSPLIGHESLISLDGDRHQRQRQLLMPSFHGERMQTYGSLMREITQRVAEEWVINLPFSVRPAMQEISLRVILQAVFGLGQGDRFEQLRQLLRSVLDLIGSPLSSSLLFMPSLQRDWGAWSPWGTFLRQRARIDELLYSEIRQRRKNFDPTRQDILTLLLAARDEAGQPMSDVELRDELMTLLLAGHETTASALTWALYWVHRVPHVRTRLLQELRTAGRDADPAAIARLPYLSAVCQETLRIFPVTPIAFPRITTTRFEVMGHRFAPDTVLIPCVYLAHHRPDTYPDSKQFKPERFLERQFSPYEYLPFGGSNRRCIGMAFALFEMKLVLAEVLSCHQLQLLNNRDIKPIRRGVTLAPPSHLKMIKVGQRWA